MFDTMIIFNNSFQFLPFSGLYLLRKFLRIIGFLKIKGFVFEGHQEYFRIAPQAQSTLGHTFSLLPPERWTPQIQFGCINGGN